MIEPKKVFSFRKGPSSESGEIVLLMQVSADLPYFDGHFPGHPVFPAVGIIDASVEAIRQHQGVENVYLKKIQSAKFMDLIRPLDEVQITLLETQPNHWTITWKSIAEKKLSELLIEI